MIRSMRPRPVSIGGRPMDSFSELFGIVDLLDLDFVEVHAADDLGQRLAVVHLAAAGLRQGGHRADGLAEASE